MKELYSIRDRYFLKGAIVYADKNYIYIEGDLIVSAGWDGKSKYYIINPTKNRTLKIFSGAFTTRLRYSKENHLSYPDIFEIGNIIHRSSTFHIGGDGKVCLYNTLYNKSGFDGNFEKFMQELVIPYFYDVMYFKKHGIWPRGEYAHYELGIFQFIGEEELEELTTDEIMNLCKAIINSNYKKDYIEYLDKGVMSLNLKKNIESSKDMKAIIIGLQRFKNNYPYKNIKTLLH